MFRGWKKVLAECKNKNEEEEEEAEGGGGGGVKWSHELKFVTAYDIHGGYESERERQGHDVVMAHVFYCVCVAQLMSLFFFFLFI